MSTPSNTTPGTGTATSERIGDYDILGELSSGGMGSVLLAKRRRSHGFEKLFAIKTIRADLQTEPMIRSRFLDEARLVSQLEHAAIAQVFDFGEEAGLLYLVMEYVHGVALDRIFKAEITPLPPAVALQIVAEVCRGLDVAHSLTDTDGTSLDVVHRDVSPQNIILSFDGQVKVIDFGVAQVKHRLTPKTQPGSVTGKPAYMSPEQLEGHAVDRRSDVFAAAIVLHELLTGERLFAFETLAATVTAVLAKDVPTPSSRRPELTDSIDDVVMRALAQDPKDRFATAAGMADALDGVLAQFPAQPLRSFATEQLSDLRKERDAHRASLETGERNVQAAEANEPTRPVGTPDPNPTHDPNPTPDTKPDRPRSRPHPKLEQRQTLDKKVRTSRRLLAVAMVVAGAGVGLGIVAFNTLQTPNPPIALPLEEPNEGTANEGTRVRVLRRDPPGAEASPPVPAKATQPPVAKPASKPKPKPKPASIPIKVRRPPAVHPTPPADPGTLDIRSHPTCRVQLDGKPLGTTPIHASAPAGSHTLTFISLEDSSVLETRLIEVVSKETLKIKRR